MYRLPTLLLTAASAMMLYSCEKLGICKDRNLQVDREIYQGNRLRIDGYYFAPSDTDDNGLQLNEIVVLYKSGVAGFPGNASAGHEDDYLHLTSGSADLRQSKGAWGTFRVTDSSLYLCKWKPALCGYPAVQRTCEIINDTTFIVHSTDIKGKHGTGTIEKDVIFRFRHFYPKPDSLNDFIKN